MSSRVVGTVASGSVIVAAAGGPLSVKPGEEKSHDALWVQVASIESRSPAGIVLRCHGPNDTLWCYRRNRQGHGLYELGVEPCDEFYTLSGEAPVSDEAEDVSTTWKILGAADAATQLLSLSAWTPTLKTFEESCSVEAIPPKERPADKVFERRQREQLQSLARGLRMRFAGLADAATAAARAGEDLASDLQRRLRRIQLLLREVEEGPSPPNRGGAESLPRTFAEASDIVNRLEACRKVESRLQREIVTVCSMLDQELESQIRELKTLRCVPLPAPTAGYAWPPTELLAPTLRDDEIDAGPCGPAAATPLLPPPPPQDGVASRKIL